MELYFAVSLGYSLINAVLAIIIFSKSRNDVLSKFFGFCVALLVFLGGTWYLLQHPPPFLPPQLFRQAGILLYAMFPFAFLHFMFLFLRRHDVAISRAVILAVYGAGLLCYALVLLGVIPFPLGGRPEFALAGYIYYVTWMSMLFAVGAAILSSQRRGSVEWKPASRIPIAAFTLLMLLLPTPFSLSLFAAVVEDSLVPYFVVSLLSLIAVVNLVFRHRLTMETPYRTMKAALAAANDIIIRTKPDLTIDMVQGLAYSLLGYDEKDLLGMKLMYVIPEVKNLGAILELTAQSPEQARSFESHIARRNGGTLRIRFTFVPMLSEEGIIGFLGVGRNVTEQTEGREESQHIMEKYQLLFESNPTAMWIHDIETKRFVVVNSAASQLYGFAFDEFRHITAHAITTGDEDLAPGLQWHRRKDGSSFLADVITQDLTLGTRPVRLCMVRDEPGQRGAGESPPASQEHYKRYFEQNPSGYVCGSTDGLIKTSNPAFAAKLGYGTETEILSTNLHDLLCGKNSFASIVQRLAESGELHHLDIQFRGAQGQVIDAVATVMGECDDQGTLVEVRMYLVDAARRTAREEKTGQTQRMETLVPLAGGIAHELNNILQIISLNASILERIADKGCAESAQSLTSAGMRGEVLVRQLLTLAGKTETTFELVHINTVIEEVVALMTPTLPDTIAIRFEGNDHLPHISADPNHLQQLLLYLCVNARDAMPEGGTLRIATEVLPGSSLQQRFPDAEDRDYVCVRVSDTGRGMDDSAKSRIFEPFFISRGAGIGGGLGLSVAYGIVRNQGGFIEVESEVGRGTTFQIFLAAAPGHQGAQPYTAETGEIPKGSETVMLVDDEELLLIPLQDTLQEHGYTVMVARDGVEAVEMYACHQGEIDVVISDIGLPRQDGWAAYLEMAEINPHVRVILASGNFDLGRKTEMANRGIRHFIQKPYVPEEVLRAIRTVLDAAPAGSGSSPRNVR